VPKAAGFQERGHTMKKLKAYIDEVIKEMQKVSWPSQKEIISNTVVTLVATLIIAIFIFGADRVIGRILAFVYRLA
jgi:preprotein translocase subunit SecE